MNTVQLLINRADKKLLALGIRGRARARILKEFREDLILPSLPLRTNSTVKVEFVAITSDTPEDILVVIGRRDFQFDKKTGDCIGAGTYLGR